MAILLLSGPVAVGKSTFSKRLIDDNQFVAIRSGAYLVEAAAAKGLSINRTNLQVVGDFLDEQTDCRWLVDDVAIPTIGGNSNTQEWLLDAVRKERQVHHLRAEYGDAVFHVHLTAPEWFLQQRYETRRAAGDEYSRETPYSTAIKHPNEVASRQLISIAQLVIDVSQIDLDTSVKAALSARTGALSDAKDRHH